MPVLKHTLTVELPEAETLDPASLAAAFRSGETDLIVVLGPTASGKTKFAVRLAHQLAKHVGTGASSSGYDGLSGTPSLIGGPIPEIISADSRQVYRGMDIGTGKDLEEYGDVPYHLIDIAPAGSRYNVYQYQADFCRVYQDILRRGGLPILCGGTGLYIEAAALNYSFGKDHPDIPGEQMPSKPYFIGTLVSREERVRRIDARLDARLSQGMVEEVRSLLEDGVPAGKLIAYGLEYKFVTQYVLGEISYDYMHEHLANAIHQFAKRQMTWFRGMERDGLRIHWVDPNVICI